MKRRRLMSALVALVAVVSCGSAPAAAFFYGDGLQPLQFAQPPRAVAGWPLQQQQAYGSLRFREMAPGQMSPAVIQEEHEPSAIGQAVTEDEVFACANGACDDHTLPPAPDNVGLPQPEELAVPKMVPPAEVQSEGGDPATGGVDPNGPESELCDEAGECVVAQLPADGFAHNDESSAAVFARKVQDLTFAIRRKAKNVLEAEEWVKQVEEILTRYTDKVRRVKKHVAKEREGIRTLLKEKKRMKDEQKRKELEDKLKQASDQLTGLKDALTEVKDKRDDFVDEKRTLELKVTALRNMLSRLKGDDNSGVLAQDITKLVDEEALKEVIAGKDAQATQEAEADALETAEKEAEAVEAKNTEEEAVNSEADGSDADVEAAAQAKVDAAEAEGQRLGEAAAAAQQEEEAAAEEEAKAAYF